MNTTNGLSKHRKIAVVGARNVGKSSLTVQYVESHFVESYYPTIENQFTKQVVLGKTNYTLEICDTAGQDEFSLVNTKSLIGLKGVAIVYSCVNRASFEIVELIRDKIIDQLGLEHIPTVVVANKIDLREELGDGGDSVAAVTRLEGAALAKRLNAGFVECSAKLNVGVNDVVLQLLKRIEGHDLTGGNGNGSNGGNGGETGCIVI
ncbi:LAME_0E11870g1_1 [Lachancea meyersii CBS 8951]|uniref:LAME_0E11870g1_1 n=1 Tax=Lachancea meyersii CBS 8951 TaxID=1266667 RepID=A0A1G4JLA2_9SACH|nr:LAME_0E11870g1_1 [Lachancea meyersii CBS 8951]